MAETKTVNLEVNSNLAQTEQAVISLKTELRKAQAEVASLSNKFGATSKEAIEAAKRAAELKDRIGDAKDLTDSFNPDSKFKALAGAANIAAGALSGFEGAMALVGVQSEEAQQAILKVQGALALSQGLEQLQTIPDTFKNIKAVAVDALKGIKTGIAATGIGLFIVALGTVYAYWDDIKEAVSGVTEEQKKQNSLLSKNVEEQNKKLTSLSYQENSLKLQGLSEKEILNKKLQQYDLIIKSSQAQIKSDKLIQEQREKYTERNAEILKNIIQGSLTISTLGLRLLAAPIDLLIATANKVSKTLGFGEIVSTNLNEELTEITKKVSKFSTSFLFDPDKIKAEGDKANEEARLGLEKLKSEKDGIALQIKQIDDKSLEDKKKNSDEAIKIAEEEAKALAEHKKMSLENDNQLRDEVTQAISDAQEKQSEFLVSAQDSEEQKVKDKYFRLLELAKQQGRSIDEINALQDAKDNELNEIRLKKQQENADKEVEIAKAVAQQKKDLQDAQLNVLDGAVGFLSTIAGKNKALQKAAIIAENALAIGKMFINTSASNIAATAQGVALAIPTQGASVVAAANLVTANNISLGIGVATSIAATAKALSALGGGSAGGGGSMSKVGGNAAPKFNVVGNSGVNQIAEGMNRQAQSPIQAYVVAQNVTTAQGLNRAIVNNASLG